MATFNSVLIWLESLGLTDVVIPLILIFSVIYALMVNVKIFSKKVSLITALAVSLITVVPHVTNSYPKCFDVVMIINNAAPKFWLVLVGFLMFQIILGLFGIKQDFFTKVLPLIAIVLMIFTVYTYLTSNEAGCELPKFDIPWWLLWLLLPLLILAAIIGFITKDDKGGKKDPGNSAPKPPKNMYPN